MARPKIKWNNPAFREIRLLPEVTEHVYGLADELATNSGNGYVAFASTPARNRARAAVVTVDFKAIRDNARNNTLLVELGKMTGATIYTTKAGKTRLATQAQIDNWTRGSR